MLETMLGTHLSGGARAQPLEATGAVRPETDVTGPPLRPRAPCHPRFPGKPAPLSSLQAPSREGPRHYDEDTPNRFSLTRLSDRARLGPEDAAPRAWPEPGRPTAPGGCRGHCHTAVEGGHRPARIRWLHSPGQPPLVLLLLFSSFFFFKSKLIEKHGKCSSHHSLGRRLVLNPVVVTEDTVPSHLRGVTPGTTKPQG